MITAAQASAKYKSKVQSGATAYSQGIDQVTESPMELAVAQQDKMVTNWNQAINSGKWATNTRAVTIAQWKSAAKSKGATNYASSAEQGSAKYQQWATTAYPVIAEIRAEVRAMPSTTLADNVQRAVRNIELMAERLG